jgi:hypothetical protein
MSDWRGHVLKEFTPGVQPITVVADPDGLLTEPRLSEALAERGFELLLFEDSISFRFAFESRYRPRLDAREGVDVVVVHRGDRGVVSDLPYDVLAKGQQLSLSLGDIFPYFSYPVLRCLDSQYFDQLYEAQVRFTPGILGENSTKDFILRHVFLIAPELIKTDSDLLRTLLRRHYQPQVIAREFITRFVQVMSQSSHFAEWPLSELVSDRSLFFAFLQERWPLFLTRLEGHVDSSPDAEQFMVGGPKDVPFDDPDVRIYMDNLFVEGMLQPIPWARQPKGWAAVGVERDSEQDYRYRLAALLDLADRDLPDENSQHGEWLAFAQTWAQINVVIGQMAAGSKAVIVDRVSAMRKRVDSRFEIWIQKRIGSLSSLPAMPPVMVHQIARYMVATRESKKAEKVALLVLDGVALDQWLIVRRVLVSQQPNWRFEDGAAFAWVPTITCVSRQSIFAGKAPMYFPTSIYGTAREESLWKQFWVEHATHAQQVTYLKGLGEWSTLQTVDEISINPQLRIMGLVVDKVDRIMHGMELGSTGMHNQVRQWADEGFLAALIDLLLGKGFAVFLTADHGNVEALGCGSPKEGVTTDMRGERSRIYSDAALRDTIAFKFPNSIAWKPIGLPDDFLPLIAPGRTAFVRSGDKTVAHGGITLEEVVVPFIRVFGGMG